MEKLPEYLEPEDIDKLISSASTYKNELIIRTMYVLALRVSECTNILLTHIDHRGKKVIVYGKFGKSRVLIVPDQLYNSWMEHIEKRHPKEFLFENAFGEPYDTRRVRTIVYEAADKADIEHTWPHKLRHSRATQLLNTGMPLKRLQRFLGHAHEFTTGIYTHLAVEGDRQYM